MFMEIRFQTLLMGVVEDCSWRLYTFRLAYGRSSTVIYCHVSLLKLIFERIMQYRNIYLFRKHTL